MPILHFAMISLSKRLAVYFDIQVPLCYNTFRVFYWCCLSLESSARSTLISIYAWLHFLHSSGSASMHDAVDMLIEYATLPWHRLARTPRMLPVDASIRKFSDIIFAICCYWRLFIYLLSWWGWWYSILVNLYWYFRDKMIWYFWAAAPAGRHLYASSTLPTLNAPFYANVLSRAALRPMAAYYDFYFQLTPASHVEVAIPQCLASELWRIVFDWDWGLMNISFLCLFSLISSFSPKGRHFQFQAHY